MVANPRPHRFTVREYLALEEASDIKHEFIDGEIVAMAGADLPHNVVCSNLISFFKDALRERRCIVVGSDQRVKVDHHASNYLYPDLTITCGTPQLIGPAPRALINPDIVIEVLSPSTAQFDRGPKWLAYQRIPSLTDFILVSSDLVLVEHFQRTGNAWTYRKAERGESITLSNGLTLPIDPLYDLVPDLQPS